MRKDTRLTLFRRTTGNEKNKSRPWGADNRQCGVPKETAAAMATTIPFRKKQKKRVLLLPSSVQCVLNREVRK